MWWRLVIAAPLTAAPPPDDGSDEHKDEDSGPLHHRFAVADRGYVPSDVLHADVERRQRVTTADGELDLARRVLRAVVDGLGVAVSLGRLRPDEAASPARAHGSMLALAVPR